MNMLAGCHRLPNHSLPAQAAGQGSGPGQLGAKMGRGLGRAAQLEAVRLHLLDSVKWPRHYSIRSDCL